MVGGLYLADAGSSYSTEIGEVRRVALDDGSTAALNTDSKVEIAFAKKARVVRLDRGEVWFEVHKDTTRHFEVEAGDIRVRAVGTALDRKSVGEGKSVAVRVALGGRRIIKKKN